MQRNAARPAMGRLLPMLTVYGRKSSFNVQKVMWLVGELGIVHTHVELGGSHGGLGTAEFRAMNPHGRVPVVDDTGTIIWESHAILPTLQPVTAAAAFGATMRRNALYPIAGWTGHRPRCSRIFSSGCSGPTTALPLRNEIWLRWTRRYGAAARIFC